MFPPSALFAQPLTRHFDKRTATALGSLGIETCGELLTHYPRRYGRRGELTPLRNLTIGEDVTVVSQVLKVSHAPARNRRIHLVHVTIGDHDATMTMTFFARNSGLAQFMATKLKVGTWALFAGEVKAGRSGQPELTHPDWEVVDEGDDPGLSSSDVNRPIPIYPATAKIRSWRIRQAVQTLLDPLEESDVPDVNSQTTAPDDDDEHWSALRALRAVHQPLDLADARRGHDYLAFNEALVLQTAVMQRRREHNLRSAVPLHVADGPLGRRLEAALPFTLTRDQRNAIGEITRDLGEPIPMARLLQADVGAGKTVVALRAAAVAVDSGAQVALLAPTEVLARQHARTARQFLRPPGAPNPESPPLSAADVSDFPLAMGQEVVHLITSQTSRADRSHALAALAAGDPCLVIGTHALLQADVIIPNLALVIIDEQQRFGVDQRDYLRQIASTSTRTGEPSEQQSSAHESSAHAVRTQGVDVGEEGRPDRSSSDLGSRTPHQLMMTATPIPRSITMTYFGDIDVTRMETVPSERAPRLTHVVPALKLNWMERMIQVMRGKVDSGGRAYVVVPRIAGDEQTSDEGGYSGEAASPADTKSPVPSTLRDLGELLLTEQTLPSLTAVADVLSRLPALAGIDVAVVHGRMRGEEKNDAIDRFTTGAAPILVSTTVIEVGVDVPEADVMIICAPEHFGLAQLHQLRGRVGRSNRESVCFLLTGSQEASPAWERLTRLAQTENGFEIAELDATYRHGGDVLGTAQHGRSRSLRLLDVIADRDLISRARARAEEVVTTDPGLIGHQELAGAVAELRTDEREAYLDRG